MKTIDKIEKVKNMNVLLEDVGINRTFYWAYIRTQETTNENLDFEDVIWESDVEGIIKNCKEFGLKEITISSRFASLIDILAEFEKYKRKFQEKKQKDANQFEEIVREVIHMRKATYNDIKNMTVFQLQDTYKTYLYMEKDNREWMMMTNPLYQPDKKNNKTWMDETKIKRD